MALEWGGGSSRDARPTAWHSAHLVSRSSLSLFLPVFGVLACTAVAVSWPLASTGCSTLLEDPRIDASDGDGGDSGPAKVTICPTYVPQEGASCTQPDGTTCVFGVCDDVYGTCNAGTWHVAPNRPVPFVCPEFLPKPAEACAKCWPATLDCAYGCDPDGGAAARRATCTSTGKGSSAWQIVDQACPVRDGGADAQPTDAATDAVTDAGRD